MLNNIQELRRTAIDMAEGMNIIVENYATLLSIEEKVINLQKDINDIRIKSYMTQNLLKKCFEEMGERIMRIEDVSSVFSKIKNIKKVSLDMSSHQGKSHATAIADNSRIRDISLFKDKNILKGI